MIFEQTALAGAYVVEFNKLLDDRGFFARSFCQREFSDQGLQHNVVQCNVSFNARRGTLRGMHYQASPSREAKLVRCTRGRIHDVIVDIRPDSPTRGQWQAFELTDRNHRSLYIPEGFAHGFQTLDDDCEVLYQMFDWYEPDLARGIRFDDPLLGIEWPLDVVVISEKDCSYPDFVL